MSARYLVIFISLFAVLIGISYISAEAAKKLHDSDSFTPKFVGFEQIFKDMDVNKDEKVSPEEYRFFWGVSPDCENKFKFLDQNQDGYIELEEYLNPEIKVNPGESIPIPED